jgi:hypothetical protein
MADENDDTSELLDDDVVPEEYPPEQPYGVGERLTAAEEQSGESVEQRRRRERPDHLGEDIGRVGQLIAPGDEEGIDLESDAIATEVAPHRRRDQLDPGDPTVDQDMTQDREEVLSAEEAAMHLTDDPPMDDDDGYVND